MAVLAVALAWSPSVAARPIEVGLLSTTAEEVGRARYRFLGLALFDAALWSESGAFAWDRPFALSLTYRRSFSADALANRSITEMTKRGHGDADALEPLRASLASCFVDVGPGDRITGVSPDPDEALFYFNGVETCAVAWPDLRRVFFGIWLEDERIGARLRGAPNP